MGEDLKPLWNLLKSKQMTDLDYASFRKEYSPPEMQRQLYDGLLQAKLLKKDEVDYGTFQSNFFPVEKKNPVGTASRPGSSGQPTAPAATPQSSESFDPASLLAPKKQEIPQYVAAPKSQGWGNTPGIQQPDTATSLGIEKGGARDVVDPAFIKKTDKRIALSNARDARKGDYTSDAVEIMERNMSEKDKTELTNKSLLDRTADSEIPFKQYQAQLSALKNDQTALSSGLDGIDQEISETIGDNAFDTYEKNVADYTALKTKYDAAVKSNPQSANQYVDDLNDLQKEIEKFQQHPLVQERNQMVKAMQKNLSRFKEMETDPRLKGARQLESDQKEIQKQVDEQDWMSDASGMVIRSFANLAAGTGRLAKDVNEMIWGKDAEPTPVSDFLIDLGDSANYLFPSPSQYSRGLVTDTAKWNGYEVDFSNDKIQAVRKDGKSVPIQLTDEQISEINKLDKSKQVNWSVAPYQAANVIVDMGVMLASADKVSKGLTALKVGEKTAARTGVALATAGQMSNGMYEQGLELFDGDKKKAAEYSFFGSLAIGAVQNVFGLEQRLLTGRALNTTSLAATVGKMTPKQIGVQAAKIILKEAGGEGIEEGLIENLVTAAAQYTIGGKTDMDTTQMISDGAMGFAVGSLFAGGNVNLNEMQKSSLYNASKDPVAFGNALRAAVEKGTIKGDEDFVSQQVSRVTRIGEELSRLSPDLNQEQILDATAIIDEKINAEARLKTAKGNEELEQRYQAEVDVLNEKLNGMVAPPTEEVAQKISENQAEENKTTATTTTEPSKPQEPVSDGTMGKEGEILPADPVSETSQQGTLPDPLVTETNPTEPAPTHEPVTNFEVGKTYYDPNLDRNYTYVGEKDGMMLFDKVPKNKNEFLPNPRIDALRDSNFTRGLLQPVESQAVVANITPQSTGAILPTLVKGNDSATLIDNGYEFLKSITPKGSGGVLTLKQQQDMEADGVDMGRAEFYQQGNGDIAVFLKPITTKPTSPTVPPTPPPSEPTAAESTGDTVKKTVVTERAYEGDVRPEVKAYLEKKGLTRDVESQEEASNAAAAMVEELGVDKAVEGVKSGSVRGGLASATLFEAVAAVDEQIAASTDPEEIDYLAQKQADIISLIDDLGVEAGRFTSMFARKYLDSNIGWNANKKKSDYVKQFGSISPEVEAKFVELESQLKDLDKRLKEAEKKAAEAADAAIIETIKAEADKKKPTKASISVAGKEMAKKIRKGKLSRPGTFSAASPASLVWDAAIEIAATAVEAGSALAEAVQKGLAHIKASDWYKNLSKDKQAAAEKEYSDFLTDQQDTTGKLKVPKSLIRDLVAGGIDNVPDLVDAVRSELGLEEESDREIRDAITDYGRTINMTKDDLSVEVRRLRRVGKLLSQLEDVANKKRPLRSGLQRDKLTAEERSLQKQLREEMKGLPMDEETASNEQRTALDAAKKRLENQIEDLEREIAKGEQVKKTAKTFDGDQELEDLKKKRDEIKREHEAIFKDEEFLNAKRLEDAKKRTKKSIADLEKRLADKDFAKREKKPMLEDSELINLRAEKLRVKEEFDKEFYKAELNNRTTAQKVKDSLWEAWGITRLLTASLDASFMFVQGGMLTISNPSMAIKATKEMFKVMGSEARSDEFIRKVKAQDWYPLAKQSGLKLTEAHASLKASEELFFSGWSDAIWNTIALPARLAGKGAYEATKSANPFKATERAAVAYLDTLRMLKFQEMLDGPLNGKNFSENQQEFKDVGDAINTLTGRASLGKLETISDPLTKVIFSPRNWASQVKLFSPYALIYFSNLTPTARKMALLSLGKFVGFNTGMMMLLAALYNHDDDDETGIEFDPRSSDFMKLKLGDVRVDPWGGKIQHVTFASRMFMDALFDFGIGKGAFKNRKGEVLPLGVRNKTSDRAELALQQVFNKLSPSARLIYNNWSAQRGKDGWKQDDFGNEYSLGSDVKDALYPMFIGTIIDLQKDGFDTTDTLLTFMAFMGYGVNKYESAQESKTRKKEEKKREKEHSRKNKD